MTQVTKRPPSYKSRTRARPRPLAGAEEMTLAAFLDRSHSIAGPGFSRWLVPPAALCIHLCIGQAYAFSVFNKPLAQLLCAAQTPVRPATAKAHLDDPRRLVDRGPRLDLQPRDRVPRTVGRGLRPLGRAGRPAHGDVRRRRAVLRRPARRRASASRSTACRSCSSATASSAAAASGIGYISPVSTLIKWFPDRPGLATGTAIMGFGGGALIGAPLAVSADETLLARRPRTASRRR